MVLISLILGMSAIAGGVYLAGVLASVNFSIALVLASTIVGGFVLIGFGIIEGTSQIG